MDYSTPGFPVLHQLPKLAQTHVHWVSDAIQPSHPLSSPSPLASIFPSIRVFSKESILGIRWPQYWSFSFSINPSSEYSGPISFRIDWFDPRPVQGSLKILLQYHGSKASILWRSAFFIVQISCPYLTTGKTIALTRQNLISNKRCNVYIIGMLAERKEKQSRGIFEIIIVAKNFPKLMADTKPEISLTRKKRMTAESTAGHISFKLHTHTKEGKEKFLQEVNENHTFLQNAQPVLLKTSVIKNKRTLRDCHSQEEPRETWYLNMLWSPGWDAEI